MLGRIHVNKKRILSVEMKREIFPTLKIFKHKSTKSGFMFSQSFSLFDNTQTVALFVSTTGQLYEYFCVSLTYYLLIMSLSTYYFNNN